MCDDDLTDPRSLALEGRFLLYPAANSASGASWEGSRDLWPGAADNLITPWRRLQFVSL